MRSPEIDGLDGCVMAVDLKMTNGFRVRYWIAVRLLHVVGWLLRCRCEIICSALAFCALLASGCLATQDPEQAEKVPDGGIAIIGSVAMTDTLTGSVTLVSSCATYHEDGSHCVMGTDGNVLYRVDSDGQRLPDAGTAPGR